ERVGNCYGSRCSRGGLCFSVRRRGKSHARRNRRFDAWLNNDGLNGDWREPSLQQRSEAAKLSQRTRLAAIFLIGNDLYRQPGEGRMALRFLLSDRSDNAGTRRVVAGGRDFLQRFGRVPRRFGALAAG